MIRIIKGVYGYMTEIGSVKPKTADDEPFELTHEQEARLVGLGVAEYVTPGPIGFDEQPPDLPDLPDLPEGVEGVPEYSVDMKADELREIAKTMGLTFKVGTTKAEMVEAMDAFIAEHMVEDEEGLPEFDPTEAVE